MASPVTDPFARLSKCRVCACWMRQREAHTLGLGYSLTRGAVVCEEP